MKIAIVSDVHANLAALEAEVGFTRVVLNSLGIAVVGGLAVSQLLTLFITPVVYIYLDKIESFFKRGSRPVAGEIHESA